MTGPVTTEALREALAPALWQIRIGLPGGLPANSWEETLRASKALPGGQAAWDVARIKGEASAILAGPLAPLLAALQQVTAERDEARAEADNLRDALARLIAEQVRQDPTALARAATAREGQADA